MIAFPPVEILNIVDFPAGTYRFYFAADKRPNGLLDTPIFFDVVSVNITS